MGQELGQEWGQAGMGAWNDIKHDKMAWDIFWKQLRGSGHEMLKIASKATHSHPINCSNMAQKIKQNMKPSKL
jgi:hypothetical protein